MSQHHDLRRAICALPLLLAACAHDTSRHAPSASPDVQPVQRHAVIVMVWDGLRPDSISAEDTPNLLRLRGQGVNFSDHHSLFPTVTMMNAAALATGAYPRSTGFYANTIYEPGAQGTKANGETVDFSQPTFSEDWKILSALDEHRGGRLLDTPTLFEAAQAAGLRTVVVGKSGPAFLQDRHHGGPIIDENFIWPLSLVNIVKTAGLPLPANTALAHAPGTVQLAPDNGDPTAQAAAVRMRDSISFDGSDTSGSVGGKGNAYLMRVYLEQVLPREFPQLSLVWLRDPDSTEHFYGPGSPNYHAALRDMDAQLGRLLDTLHALGRDTSTNLIIVSDHGHSTVAGDAEDHPLREIRDGEVGQADTEHGFSTSGEVRLAQRLHDAGFAAFDGRECTYSPVLSGIDMAGRRDIEDWDDRDGSICGKPMRYTTPRFKVPVPLPLMQHPIVIAINGGSEYLYLPDHDTDTAARAVAFLQTQREVGPIFVSSRYATPAGTLPLEAVNLGGDSVTAPDILVTYRYNADARVQGLPGTDYNSMVLNRGTHGSFSPRDVHNTLIAIGPDFHKAWRDELPSANVDVAPTVAALLGLKLPSAQGRVLREALITKQALEARQYRIESAPIDAQCDVAGCPQGRTRVYRRVLHLGEQQWPYFDRAERVMP